ncbi:MAG: hypothetical protein WCJ63_01630 [Actinomycetes bacterium]
MIRPDKAVSTSSQPAQSSLARSRRFGIAAIICVGLGVSLLVQSPGWAQASYYGLVRAMGNGTAQIDKYHWEGGDKSWINGHFYSVKSPGLPVVVLPLYGALNLVGFDSLSKRAGETLMTDVSLYSPERKVNVTFFGGSTARALEVRRTSANSALMIWALTLLGSVVPALGIMFLTRSVAERMEPGTGAASSIALGMGTIFLPFSGMFFSHLIATFALFAGFVVLLRERAGPPSQKLLFLAGLLAGLAVFLEYPLAFGGVVIGAYAMLRQADGAWNVGASVRRALAYSAGALLGALPVAFYNLWAFGSVTTMSYQDTVAIPGRTGHDVIGLVNGGLFGIGVPKPLGYASILLSPRGLFALTPILIMATLGVILMYRRGKRAEALAIAGVAAIYWTYVAGYIWPMGGQVTGPRYMIPMLPFVGLGLPYAWKRFPSATLATAIVSSSIIVVATVTNPLVKELGLSSWSRRLTAGDFQPTVFTLVGGGHGWASILPVLGLFGLAGLLAALATWGLDFSRDRLAAAAVLGGWVLIAFVLAPHVREIHDPVTVPVQGLSARLIVGPALLALLVVLGANLWQRFAAQGQRPSS